MKKDIILCFPHAGGSKNYFLNIFSDKYSVVGVEYPGHGSRLAEKCCKDINSLVEDVWNQIFPRILKYDEQRIILFGHSMGGVIAYKIAEKLDRRGIIPSALIISSKSAPIYDFVNKVNYLINDNNVREFLELYDGTPKELLDIPEMFELIKNVIISDTKVLQSYVRQININSIYKIITPIYLLRGIDDMVNEPSMEYWKHYSVKCSEVHSLPGNHFYFDKSKDEMSDLISSIITNSLC